MKTHKVNIKDFNISGKKLKKIEKATSYINKDGELIQYKDYTTQYVPDIYIDNMVDRKSKKKKFKIKRKRKGCECK